jgi:hypothetical protein
MSDFIKFTLNEPQIIKLSDTTPDSDGSNWIYPAEGGKLLSLPPYAAVQLGALFPEVGEELSITRYRKSEREPATWVIALTPRAEHERAKREAPELERKLLESIEAARKPAAEVVRENRTTENYTTWEALRTFYSAGI